MMKPIPKGALFTVTTGEYSDYCVQGVFRALKEIDAEALRAKWLRHYPEQAVDYRFDDAAFLADMARKGLIEDVESWEFHISSYSKASEMYVAEYRKP